MLLRLGMMPRRATTTGSRVVDEFDSHQ
jgi:hypothetical protein